MLLDTFRTLRKTQSILFPHHEEQLLYLYIWNFICKRLLRRLSQPDQLAPESTTSAM